MEAFFKKYADECGEEIALKMIYNKAKEIVKHSEADEPYEKDIGTLYEMVCDFAEAAKIQLP